MALAVWFWMVAWTSGFRGRLARHFCIGRVRGPYLCHPREDKHRSIPLYGTNSKWEPTKKSGETFMQYWEDILLVGLTGTMNTLSIAKIKNYSLLYRYPYEVLWPCPMTKACDNCKSVNTGTCSDDSHSCIHLRVSYEWRLIVTRP